MTTVIAGFKYGLLLIAFGISFCGLSVGQDGSDMLYLKPDKLDKTFIGRQVHIDFYRDSRGCSRLPGHEENESRCDKLLVAINDKPIEFREYRVDDGYNNWFREQYLESTDKKLRLRAFKLTGIGKGTLTFIGYFNASPFEREFSFVKDDIFNLMFKVLK